MVDNLPANREDRWSLLAKLIGEWESPLLPEHACSSAEVAEAESRLGIRLPAALTEWYRLAGKHDRVWQQQDSFLLPRELRQTRDKLVFYVENQGVVSWGIPLTELSSPDPAVLVGNEKDADAWKHASDSISEFALAMFVYCRKFSKRNVCYGASSVGSDLIRFVTQNFSPLPLELWHWPDTPFRFFGREGLVLELEGEEEWSWLYVSAISEPAFRTVEQQLLAHGLTWEVSSEEWPRGWLTRAT